MVRLEDPIWLRLAWVAIALFVAGLYVQRFYFQRLKKNLGRRTDFLTSTVSQARRRWHLVLQCGAIACFALALARPQMGMRQQEVKQSGVEIIIAVDVSNSMMAEDDKPSRLDHAKHELSRFVDQLGGNRIGLIAFAGSAVLVSPMTTDPSAIKLFLNSLTPDSVSTQGTNFKDVMDEAIRAFDKGGVEGLNGTKPTRALVIASDGEDNEPGGLSEEKKAVDAGIRVFAIGFGTEKGAPIPIRDDRGQLKGYKKDRAGQVVMSIPSDKGLAKLAEEGGGSYYHSTFDESEVRNLLHDIDTLQKADFKTKMATEYDEKFQIPLLLGLILALIDLLFGDRRRGAKLWRGRFDTAAVLAVFVFGALFLPRPAHAFAPPSIQQNNDGVKSYQSEDYGGAFDHFAKALSKDAFNPTYHFNLGDAFFKNGDIPKAMAEFEAVDANPKAAPDLKFKAMFNAGNAAIEAKDIPKALQYYQRALEYNPDSKEVKTNIELALKEQQKQGGGGGDQDQKQKQDQNKDQNDKQQQDQKQNQDQKQKQNQNQNKDQNKNQQPQPKPTAQPFKSQDLNEGDVHRILEELKRQEEEIRAKQYKERKDTPERQIEKDW